ncbi:MAG: hypothetical protein J3Q66DRAFT_340478 [Benniella sp.]|nr:MAG: hypothetical protein J3Q66DRAFT_340478 [Benniella sp.]
MLTVAHLMSHSCKVSFLFVLQFLFSHLTNMLLCPSYNFLRLGLSKWILSRNLLSKTFTNTPEFNKVFSCFVSYVGCQRLNGISDASSRLDLEQCRKEYDGILLQDEKSM